MINILSDMKKLEIISYLIAAIVFFLVLYYEMSETIGYSIFLATFIFVLPLLIKILVNKLKKTNPHH